MVALIASSIASAVTLFKNLCRTQAELTRKWENAPKRTLQTHRWWELQEYRQPQEVISSKICFKLGHYMILINPINTVSILIKAWAYRDRVIPYTILFK